MRRPVTGPADGRSLAYTQRTSSTTSDVWVLAPVRRSEERFRCLQTGFVEASGVFLPNGRWSCAARPTKPASPTSTCNRSPGLGRKYQVSRDGGGHPVWRADGKELFYLGPDASLMAVPIDATDRFNIGAPQALLSDRRAEVQHQPRVRGHERTANGSSSAPGRSRPAGTPLTVVLNWTAAIQQ